MKAKGLIKELKIDNYAKSSKDGIIRIDAIHKNKVGYHKRDKMCWAYFNEIYPIGLTKDFMDKNFESVSENTNGNSYVVAQYKIPNLVLRLELCDDCVVRLECDNLHRCRSVHQLQNLLSEGFVDFKIKL